MEGFKITYLPSYEETKRETGIEEGEDYNSYSVLYQQGYIIEDFYVEPGEKFKITRKHDRATFQCDERTVTLKSKYPDVETEVSNEHFGLHNGIYLLSEDGKTLEFIELDNVY